MHVRANTLVVVRYGRSGEQIAQLIAARCAPEFRIVRKWLVNGRRWTNGIRIPARDVLRLATAEDEQRFKPEV